MGFFKWIGERFAALGLEREKRKSQQQVESHKAELKKSEFLYPKEVEAAEEFIALHSGLRPRYRFPEMEWDDACEDFALDFEEVEERLEQYKVDYGAVLQSGTLIVFPEPLPMPARGSSHLKGMTFRRKV